MTAHHRTLAAVLALVLATPVFAAGEALYDLDTDESGTLSMQELQEGYDISGEGFAGIDLDGNGELDEDEILAAQAAGVLPAGE